MILVRLINSHISHSQFCLLTTTPVMHTLPSLKTMWILFVLLFFTLKDFYFKRFPFCLIGNASITKLINEQHIPVLRLMSCIFTQDIICTKKNMKDPPPPFFYYAHYRTGMVHPTRMVKIHYFYIIAHWD